MGTKPRPVGVDPHGQVGYPRRPTREAVSVFSETVSGPDSTVSRRGRGRGRGGDSDGRAVQEPETD